MPIILCFLMIKSRTLTQHTLCSRLTAAQHESHYCVTYMLLSLLFLSLSVGGALPSAAQSPVTETGEDNVTLTLLQAHKKLPNKSNYSRLNQRRTEILSKLCVSNKHPTDESGVADLALPIHLFLAWEWFGQCEPESENVSHGRGMRVCNPD